MAFVNQLVNRQQRYPDQSEGTWMKLLEDAWREYRQQCALLAVWMPHHPDLRGTVTHIPPLYLAGDLELMLQKEQQTPGHYRDELIRLAQRVCWTLYNFHRIYTTRLIRERQYEEQRLGQRLHGPLEPGTTHGEYVHMNPYFDLRRESNVTASVITNLVPKGHYIFLKTPHLVPKESLAEDEQDCAICKENYNVMDNGGVLEYPTILECGHIFGSVCLHIWIQGGPKGNHKNVTQCPLCRAYFKLAYIESKERMLPSQQ